MIKALVFWEMRYFSYRYPTILQPQMHPNPIFMTSCASTSRWRCPFHQVSRSSHWCMSWFQQTDSSLNFRSSCLAWSHTFDSKHATVHCNSQQHGIPFEDCECQQLNQRVSWSWNKLPMTKYELQLKNPDGSCLVPVNVPQLNSA